MDAGDYERLVMEHKDRILAYASLMLRDATEGQDVAQEALIRLWHHRGSVDRDGAPHWLRRTAHNLCIDQLRRRRTRGVACPVEPETLEAVDAPDAQRVVESGELGREIERALGALPLRDRAVLVLRDVQGLPYGEIATLLEVPLGTLKARLHRARETLRDRLARAGLTPC
jgi:RNA polymerase sigma-70 factor (ECF subfamily)